MSNIQPDWTGPDVDVSVFLSPRQLSSTSPALASRPYFPRDGTTAEPLIIQAARGSKNERASDLAKRIK